MITLLILTLLFIGLSRSSNILGLMGSVSHKHHLWNNVIFEELADKGHHLTIVSTDMLKAHHHNINFIHLEQTVGTIDAYFDKNNYDQKLFSTGYFSNLKLFYDYQLITCQGIIKSNGFKTAINLLEDMEFDVILYDMSNGPCLIKFIEKYSNVPVIGVSASKILPSVLNMIGGHSFPANIPYLTANYDTEMNFQQRSINTALYFSDFLYKNYICYPVIGHMIKDFFPEHKASIIQLENRINSILMGTHSSLDYLDSLPRNVIEIGGLHIKNAKPLPTDIEEFIGESKDGFVLISLDNTFSIRDEMIGEDRLNAIVKVMERCPELKFLWQLQKRDLLKSIPKNLLVRKWLPQNDILAHRNIKAFITSAESLSIQEATFYGVPLVTVPILLDQHSNAYRATVRGVAENVDFFIINESILLDALNKIRNNSKYAENQKKIAIKFKERQNHPLDTAVWWIEYFIRNQNNSQLISSSRDMSFFKSNSLDMLTIFLIFNIILIGNTIFVLKQFFKTKTEIKKVKKIRDLTKINKTRKIKTKTN